MTGIKKAIIILTLMNIWSCNSIPEKVSAVSPFDKLRYLGKWYEIARFDFRFERNLNNTTANYSLKQDGSIEVINRGFNTITKQWSQAEGKAKFTGSDTIAMLKVSFFGPFYAGYNVIAIDPEYRYALVCGSNHDYLWILSREKSIQEEIKTSYLALAQKNGFDTSKLLWIQHD